MKVELIRRGNFAKVAESLNKYGIAYELVEDKGDARIGHPRPYMGGGNLFVIDDNGNRTSYMVTPFTLILLKNRLNALSKASEVAKEDVATETPKKGKSKKKNEDKEETAK